MENGSDALQNYVVVSDLFLQVSKTAHCADFFRPQDPPGLGQTQQLIDQQIGKWPCWP